MCVCNTVIPIVIASCCRGDLLEVERSAAGGMGPADSIADEGCVMGCAWAMAGRADRAGTVAHAC